MTKQEFKKRWEANPEGGGITIGDIIECAKAWGILSSPTQQREDMWYRVLKAAEVVDAEEYAVKR
jgi:hypothetical protein